MGSRFRLKPLYVKLTTFILARSIENRQNETFKIKVRLRMDYVGQFSKLCLRQQLFAFKEFCMKMRLPNIFKTTNVTMLNKAILESSCINLQVTSKCKTLKQPVCFEIFVLFWRLFFQNKNC